MEVGCENMCCISSLDQIVKLRGRGVTSSCSCMNISIVLFLLVSHWTRTWRLFWDLTSVFLTTVLPFCLKEKAEEGAGCALLDVVVVKDMTSAWLCAAALPQGGREGEASDLMNLWLREDVKCNSFKSCFLVDVWESLISCLVFGSCCHGSPQVSSELRSSSGLCWRSVQLQFGLRGFSAADYWHPGSLFITVILFFSTLHFLKNSTKWRLRLEIDCVWVCCGNADS